jgi:hypothetical protein
MMCAVVGKPDCAKVVETPKPVNLANALEKCKKLAAFLVKSGGDRTDCR